MTTLAQIRAAIKTTLSGVAGIGQVHDYERFVADLAQLRSLYVNAAPDGKLRGFHIRRIATTETAHGTANARLIIVNRWQIRGVQAIEDASATEKSFDDLIEAIRDAVRANPTLGLAGVSTVTPGDRRAGVQVDDSGPAMFAGVLVHFAKLSLSTFHVE